MFTSKVIDNESRGQKHFEVNIRCVMGFWKIEAGLESIKTFSNIMNMAQPVTKKTYNDINCVLLDAYLAAIQRSMT